MKNPLSQSQKETFEREFAKIILNSNSIEAKELYKKMGKILWHPYPINLPITNNIELKLKGKDADKFNTLLNKLKNGTI